MRPNKNGPLSLGCIPGDGIGGVRSASQEVSVSIILCHYPAHPCFPFSTSYQQPIFRHPFSEPTQCPMGIVWMIQVGDGDSECRCSGPACLVSVGPTPRNASCGH